MRPGRRTRELLDQIRVDSVQDPLPVRSAPANIQQDATGNDSIREVLPHLRRVLSILSDTQSRIEDEVQAINQELPPNPPSQILAPPSKLRVNQR